MAKTILLADDSVTIQKVVELTFMDQDYQVVAVSDGQAAISKLSELRPDLVIADVHMPEANGYEVCRQAKQTHPGIPVLLLVGTFEPFDQQQADAVGAEAHLKKPFDSQDLLRQVDTLVSQAAPAPSPAAAPAVEAPPAAAPAPVAAVLIEPAPAQAMPPMVAELVAPIEPVAPVEPVAAPVEPAAEPAAPVEPVAPVEFLAPVEPAAPIQPVAPIETVAPIEPVEPVATVEPAAPPNEPVAPVEPVAPMEPVAFPAEPVAAPVEPVEPHMPPPAAVFEETTPPPIESVMAEPVAPPEPAADPEPTSAASSNGQELSDADLDRIARRVVDLLGDTVLRQVAWEVIPDLAEVVIKERIRELESQVE